MNKEIIIFKDGELVLEVNVSENRETIWLTQDQMADLFEVDRTRITRHISNIYKDNELSMDLTCAENALVQSESSLKTKEK